METKVQNWPPAYLSPVSNIELANSRGYDIIDFAETLCRVTEDSIAGNVGDKLVLRPWQKELLLNLYAEDDNGLLKHRRALIGIPRKAGKSALLSTLVLEQLLLGVNGGQIYSCAADKEQAKIIFKTVKRMVELEPELSSVLQTFRDVIYNPGTGTVYRALSSEAFTKEGLNSTFVAFDELHSQPNRELYDTMSLSMGARLEPMLVAITTAGTKYDSSGKESLCYQMYQRGVQIAKGEVKDPSFFFAWYQGNEKLNYKDEDNWKIANPSYDDILSAEDMRSASLLTPEAEFKTKRLNLWTDTGQTWIPSDVWEDLTLKDRQQIPGEDVVIGFDGSFNGDATAIVAWFLGGEKPHLDILGIWERPINADQNWFIPVAEVESCIIDAYRNLNYSVREIVFDPARYSRTFMLFDEEGMPVVSYPNTAERMVPSTAKFYEAIMNRSFTHSGHEALNRHVANAMTKTSSRGLMIQKANSKKKIDACVAAIFSYDRATVPVAPKIVARFHSI
jgi:phage terminase large subunit-like protein